MKAKSMLHVVYGLLTFLIPGSHFLLPKRPGGSDTARYCYSVWLRHLVMAGQNGFSTAPKIVAEIGPGDSIGVGLAALLSGVEKYLAVDVVKFSNLQRNIKVFEDLVNLFRQKEDIPGDDEFPKVNPKLKSYAFPHHILSDDRLSVSLSGSRVDRIRRSILNSNAPESMVSYVAPWYDTRIVEKETVDMIYSQAVMEHVDDLSLTYKVLFEWLKPNGYMSHQIDFKCHGTADEWNGHWTYSDFMWNLIRGKRPYLLNREPHSTHIRLLNEAGFRIVCDMPVKLPSEITRLNLARRFRNILEDDLTTSGALIQVCKGRQ